MTATAGPLFRHIHLWTWGPPRRTAQACGSRTSTAVTPLRR
ncbi:hypothetical protein F750_0350 [Streptomyces sp. PAMC 26508]|nr:hypothetical protein F750_0350 [Streptomyces sp. PAMC 26508]